MADFLFRGQATNREAGRHYRTSYNNGDWVYGLVSRLDKNYGFTEMTNEAGVSGIDVDPNTIAPYIGIDDKNGTKIFKDDIVKVHVETYTSMHDTVGVIDYWSGAFGVIYGNGKHFLAFNEMSMYCRWVEVIGNKFDNPELLEEINK
jgi:uncharacterized phage protein (TIGR01671 family)